MNSVWRDNFVHAFILYFYQFHNVLSDAAANQFGCTQMTVVNKVNMDGADMTLGSNEQATAAQQISVGSAGVTAHPTGRFA